MGFWDAVVTPRGDKGGLGASAVTQVFTGGPQLKPARQLLVPSEAKSPLPSCPLGARSVCQV